MRRVLPREGVLDESRGLAWNAKRIAAERKEPVNKPWAGNKLTPVPKAMDPNASAALDARWNMAFLGLMFYAFIEYSRLPEMYPIFKIFYFGKVAIILALLGYLLSPRIRNTSRSATHSIDVAVMVFIIGNAVSSCFAFSLPHVWEGLFTVVYCGLVYFLVSRNLTNTWQIRIFLSLVLLLNLKFAQHTVRSYLTDRSTGMSDSRIIMSGGAGEGGASFFGNVADLGLAMGVVWGIVWALLAGKPKMRKSARAFLLICFGFYLLAILLCGSRGAVVGAAAIVLVALRKSAKKVGAIVLAIIFLLGVWFVLPDASKDRFRSAMDWKNDPNSASRIMFWGIGIDMWEYNPILGIGPGNFADMNPIHFVSHSLYIQVLSESGLVGTISLAVILFLFFRLNARTRKLALERPGGRRNFEYRLAFGLDLGMVGYLTSGAFLSVLYYPHLWVLLGLSVAIHQCCLRKQPAPEAAERAKERNFALAAS